MTSFFSTYQKFLSAIRSVPSRHRLSRPNGPGSLTLALLSGTRLFLEIAPPYLPGDAVQLDHSLWNLHSVLCTESNILGVLWPEQRE